MGITYKSSDGTSPRTTSAAKIFRTRMTSALFSGVRFSKYRACTSARRSRQGLRKRMAVRSGNSINSHQC